MKLEIVALHDVKVGEYMTPFFAQSVGAAVRSVADLVNGGGQEPPALHPEDFRLFHLGTWFGEGLIDVKAGPELVAECVNLKHERV